MDAHTETDPERSPETLESSDPAESTGPIEGTYQKALADQLQSVFAAPARIFKAALFFYLLCAALVVFVQYMDELEMTTGFIMNAAYVSLVAPLLFALILMVVNIIYFFQQSRHHKTISYRIGQAGVELFDAAGHAHRISWGMMKSIRNTPGHFVLLTRTGWPTALPKRGFTKAQRKAFMRLAFEKGVVRRQ